jgi:hypothetical protein
MNTKKTDKTRTSLKKTIMRLEMPIHTLLNSFVCSMSASKLNHKGW